MRGFSWCILLVALAQLFISSSGLSNPGPVTDGDDPRGPDPRRRGGVGDPRGPDPRRRGGGGDPRGPVRCRDGQDHAGTPGQNQADEDCREAQDNLPSNQGHEGHDHSDHPGHDHSCDSGSGDHDEACHGSRRGEGEIVTGGGLKSGDHEDHDHNHGHDHGHDHAHGHEASDVCSMAITCGRNGGVRTELPIKGITGERGSPGMPGLPGRTGSPGVAGTPGHSGRSGGGDSCKIAFSVGLSKPELTLGPSRNLGKVVLFDKIVSNTGNVYRQASGKFFSPVKGTFLFHVTATADDRQRVGLVIKHNDEPVAAIRANSADTWGSASNSIILNLNSGDKVYLELDYNSQASSLQGDMHTTFSGSCLWGTKAARKRKPRKKAN